MLQQRELTAAERKLVEALRSGRYLQTDGALRRNEKYCCLGVACDISDLGKWSGGPLQHKYIFETRDLNLSDVYLAPAIRKWLGWSNTAGRLNFLDRAGDVVYLAGLNDEGFTFSEIADLIEAGLVERG